MIKCKDCKNKFEPPKDTIILARVVYCPKCYKKRLKAIASMSISEFMKHQANSYIK